MKARQSAIILSVVVFGSLLAIILAHNSKQKIVYVPAPASSSPQQSVAASSAPNPNPKVLLDVSGNGDQQTQPFTTSGDWTLTYTYDCSNFGDQGDFAANIKNADNSTNYDNGPDVTNVNTGNSVAYYYDGGQHYLSIISECEWHVVVRG